VLVLTMCRNGMKYMKTVASCQAAYFLEMNIVTAIVHYEVALGARGCARGLMVGGRGAHASELHRHLCMNSGHHPETQYSGRRSRRHLGLLSTAKDVLPSLVLMHPLEGRDIRYRCNF